MNKPTWQKGILQCCVLYKINTWHKKAVLRDCTFPQCLHLEFWSPLHTSTPFRNYAVDLGRGLQKKKHKSEVQNSFHLIRHEMTRSLWHGKEKHETGRMYGTCI